LTKVNYLNANTPFLQGVPNSQITREWFLILNNIATILGGGQEVGSITDIENSITTIDEIQQIYNSAPSVFDNTNNLLNVSQQLATMSTLIQNNQQLKDRISALESQLQSIGKNQVSSDPLLMNLISGNRPLLNTSTNSTNLSGGLSGSIPYQTAPNTTSFFNPSNYGLVIYSAAGIPSSISGSAGVLQGSASATPAFTLTPTLTGTNFSGTAASLTAGAVTTNANLTGPITSSGNATAVAAQTGTGSTFVMQESPTLTTPNIGAATGTSLILSGASSNQVSVEISSISTNINPFIIVADAILPSTATTGGAYFRSLVSTAASAFNVTNVNHFAANQGTIGAGSTLTSQSGFSASSNMTGATNNFGFSGNIVAGTTNWNLYMTGTAKNYLAGNLLLGSNTDGGQQLQVTGTSIYTGTRTFTVPDNVAASVPTIASATTIAPTTPILFVSGVTSISTITAPAGMTNGGQITIIPTGLFTTLTTGNIALASTMVVNKANIFTYVASTSKWYPSY